MEFIKQLPKYFINKVKYLGLKKLIIICVVTLLGVLVIIQLFYPSNKLLPFTKIDGQNVAGKSKKDAINVLNNAYNNYAVDIYMGSGAKSTVSPKLSKIDIKIDNQDRVSNIKYPWYLRLVPSSIFWAGLIPVKQQVELKYGTRFDDYVTKNIMPSCKQDPINAGLKYDGNELVLVPSVLGGVCEKDDVIKSIKAVKPSLLQKTKIVVKRLEQKPQITNKVADDLAKRLNKDFKNGINLQTSNDAVLIKADTLLPWLDFTADNEQLKAVVNAERAGSWLNQTQLQKVYIKPGVSYIKTLDFTETSRVNGTNGQTIDIDSTIESIQNVIDGGISIATLMVKDIPPTEQYTRSYSPDDTGLNALMANFAKDNPGTYGMTMIELDGKKRRASFNGDKQFVTASTYKLFVAYSLLKQIDNGTRSWESSADCFNKMISLSDNSCAEQFLNSIGPKVVTTDIQAIGLKNSTFLKPDNIYSTPNDLALLLGMLVSNQNFTPTNASRLIDAMKGNIYRRGIPAGVSGTVADKVGFMNGLLHDASIVYSLGGNYILVVMSDGSTWGNIANLAGQIDSLRSQ